MSGRVTIVVTSISSPNGPLRALAEGAAARDWSFIVVGDVASPSDFALDGCRYLSVDDQLATGFTFAAKCPTRHYARKNVGYLLAVRDRAPLIVETDDDNFPRPSFFAGYQRRLRARAVESAGWLNAYRYFSDAMIWPRGFPLDRVGVPPVPFAELGEMDVDCPIQQGLADDNPDVDAIYRLLLPLPQTFRSDRRVALTAGAWCPFNSQNTAWWPDAYALLYLPAYCSFRMTDIWRSFVAQRIAWENGWSILFREPTVHQARNAHDLMRDFADEVPGYLNNRRLCDALANLSLVPGPANIAANMQACYGALVELELVGAEELVLLDCWLADLSLMGG